MLAEMNDHVVTTEAVKIGVVKIAGLRGVGVGVLRVPHAPRKTEEMKIERNLGAEMAPEMTMKFYISEQVR